MSKQLCLLVKKVESLSCLKNLKLAINEKINSNNSSPGSILNSLSKLYSDNHISVGIERLRRARNSRYCTTQDRSIALSPISELTLNVSEYVLNRTDSKAPLQLIKSTKYEKGETAVLERNHIYSLDVSGDGVVVIGKENYSTDVVDTYCLSTGTHISTTASNNQHSKLQFAADLLGRFPDTKSLNVLKALSNHEAHFVRWQAAQSFAMIAPTEETIKMLKDFTQDPHTQIREAAISSLNMVEEVE